MGKPTFAKTKAQISFPVNGYVRGSPNGKICKTTNGTVGTIFTNGNQKTLNVFSTNGTIGRSHGGIFIILINTPHLFLFFLFTSCILCYL